MRSKAKAEKLIVQNQIPYSILRFPAVLGKNDTYISPTIISNLIANTFFFSGNKDRIISVFYVNSMGPLISRIIKKGPINEAVNCVDYQVKWPEYVQEYATQLIEQGFKINFDPTKKKAFITLIFHFRDKKYALMICFANKGMHFPNKRLIQLIGDSWIKNHWHDGVTDAINSFIDQYKRNKEKKQVN